MIVNPIVAAAAVAARALTSFRRPEPSSSHEAFPASQYFAEMEEASVHRAAPSDPEDFYTDFGPPTATARPVCQDAEILKKQKGADRKRDRKPPPLPDTNNPLALLGLDPGADFDAIHRAYRKMAKVYHPDVAVGPDASGDDRKAANLDFARINSAFDILKRRESEEVLEYDVYVDGERVTRSVVVSEESRRRDPHAIDYGRIAEIGRRRARERMWYEEDHAYQPRRNGFEIDGSASDPYSRGRWWTDAQAFECVGDVEHSPRRDSFGPIPSRESTWGEETTHSVVNPWRDQWWEEGNHVFDFHPPRDEAHEYRPRGGGGFHGKMKQGYPYKETVWNEGQNFNALGLDHPASTADTSAAVGFDYDPQEQPPFKDKWWRGDDYNVWDFAP